MLPSSRKLMLHEHSEVRKWMTYLAKKEQDRKEKDDYIC